MRVLVLGAAGMIGARLSAQLARAGALGSEAIDGLTLVDISAPEAVDGSTTVAADITRPGTVDDLLADRPQLIVDLAAVVSGEAEADLEKGYRVNLDGTRELLDAIRRVGDGYRPRLVFSSSIAVFGPPLPKLIGDEQATTPASSYGTQKAIAELLVSDLSRRGVIDGVAVRLPTVCVRPGTPNQAASGFFSNIIREPLNGQPAVLPVARDVRHWFASPRAAVGFLVHAAALQTEDLGHHRALTMPGVSATVQEEIDALRRVGGDEAVALIRDEPDETIARLVSGWPSAFDARRAISLGFAADRDFDEIVRIHVEEQR